MNGLVEAFQRLFNFLLILTDGAAGNKGVIQYGSRVLLSARDNFHWADTANADAVIGLILANPKWYTPTNADAVATVRAMDLELLVALSRDRNLTSERWSHGAAAKYASAVQATCRDPSDFYGYNLLALIQQHMTDNNEYFQNNRFALSWTVIALCNNDVDIDAASMATLVANPGSYKFGLSEASMILMATICLQSRQSSSEVKEAAASAEQFIIDELKNNFTEYNQYSISLAVQALAAANSDENGIMNKSLKYLRKKVLREGRTFMKLPGAGSHVLPALAMKSYLDIPTINCPGTDIIVEAKSTTTTASVPLKPDVEISITANNFTNNMGLWHVSDTLGQSLFKFMVKLNDTDPTFSFQTISYSFGEFVTTINGLEANSSLNQFWEISQEGKGPLNTGVSTTFPKGGENYVFNLTTWA